MSRGVAPGGLSTNTDAHATTRGIAMADDEREDLEEAWRRARRAAEKLIEYDEALPENVRDDETFSRRVRTLEKELTELEQLLGRRSHLARFFEEVGRGVTDAQRHLDRETAAYNRGSPPQPSLFRIPKASAEIRFAISSLTASGMNVFVASSTEEERRQQQHSVSFDVVAAPPPADYRAQTAPLRSLVVLDPTLREHVRNRLAGSRTQYMQAFAKEEGFDHTVLFQFQEGYIGGRAEAQHSGEGSPTPLYPQLVFIPAAEDEAPQRIAPASWSPTEAASSNAAPLASFLLEMGAVQAQVLSASQSDAG